MAVVGAVLVLAGSAAHALPFDRIPLISSTLGDVQNRLCAGAATPRGQADIACPSYSPYVTWGIAGGGYVFAYGDVAGVWELCRLHQCANHHPQPVCGDEWQRRYWDDSAGGNA